MFGTKRRRVLQMLCGAGIGELSPHQAAHAAGKDEPADRWAGLARYATANQKLVESGVRIDCVFIGDSITELWLKRSPSFFKPGWECRGVIGQTTPQMLLRFRSDVVNLRPTIVHILAGTNDIAGNTGPATPEMIVDNIRTMTEIALANGIKVVIASIPPAAFYPWSPAVKPIPITRFVNAWLKKYAEAIGAVYADYYKCLDDGHGAIKAGWSTGEVHPTATAYAAMESTTRTAIAMARGLPQQRLAKIS